MKLLSNMHDRLPTESEHQDDVELNAINIIRNNSISDNNTVADRKDKGWYMLMVYAAAITILTILLSILVIINATNTHNNDTSITTGKENMWSSFQVHSFEDVVAADQAICSELGAEVMSRGGNAVDAAVAVCLCIGVQNPASSGIGGGSFMLIYNASAQTGTFIDSRETAPSAATPTMFLGDSMASQHGGLAIATLAELKGLHYIWTKYGSRNISWFDLVSPAADMASRVVISPIVANYIRNVKYELLSGQYPDLAALLLRPDGALKMSGDLLERPQLSYTLHKIAEYGIDYIYDTMASSIAEEVALAGGILSESDIRNYSVVESKPITVEVFGHRYLGAGGSSSGGAVVAGILNYLAGFSEPLVSAGGVYFHRLLEAMKHTFAIRMSLGDPAFVDSSGPLKALQSKDYMSSLRARSSDTNVLPLREYGGQYNFVNSSQPKIDHGTSHFSIMDRSGNAVAITSTVNTYFGSLVVSKSTGIIFNNQMDDFSNPTASNYFQLPPNKNNFPEPGKRPLSSMSPSIILDRTGNVRLIGGASGGPKIITGTVQVILNVLLFGMDLLSAVRAPRVHSQLFPDKVDLEKLALVSGLEIVERTSILRELQLRGQHNVSLVSAMDGVTQFIGVDMDSGLRTAVSDPRKNGRPATTSAVQKASYSNLCTMLEPIDADIGEDDAWRISPRGDGR